MRRTRIFSRVITDERTRTRVFLANPCSRDDYDVVATPSVRLLNLDGEVIGTVVPEIPPHGCVELDIAQVFGECVDALGPSGRGLLKVRDTEARLYGFCFVDIAGAPAMPLDHLIGG